MFEKVNPSHPDKIADRIAGAIVDLAYKAEKDPKIAVEILIGHRTCRIVLETSSPITAGDIRNIVYRIAGDKVEVSIMKTSQNRELARNQEGEMRCGDNGIFRGIPVTEEQKELSRIAREIYRTWGSDGKYILDGEKLIICQSCAETKALKQMFPHAIINPLGDWTGGPDVDTGAVNRKLGSDMADSATGGGLHGKDLSKADVSVTIYAFLKAQETGRPVEMSCAIGDTEVDGIPYSDIVKIARYYIEGIGGFEKLAEWGLV